MSASARNYSYQVIVKDPKKPEPVISREALAASEQRVAQYLKNAAENERKV